MDVCRPMELCSSRSSRQQECILYSTMLLAPAAVSSRMNMSAGRCAMHTTWRRCSQ